jgi:uncharacterized protein (TIGR02453 family)
MATIERFKGFPRDSLRFLRGLAMHNDREWFEERRERYESNFLEPARVFVLDLGQRLRRIAPDVRAEPRINGSILRIQRDTRFSKDKSPYKDWFGFAFWVGEGPSYENPCFFLRIGTRHMTLDAGMHRFRPDQLVTYREAVVDPEDGPLFLRAVRRIARDPALELGEKVSSRTPAGFDRMHPSADFLGYRGLYARRAELSVDMILDETVVDQCYAIFKDLAPIQRWLVRVLDDPR